MVPEKKVLFIRVKGDASYSRFGERGYQVHDPYHGSKLIGRIFREIWFRLNLPFKTIWYKKLPDLSEYNYVLVFDPLITADYLSWLKTKTSAKLIFSYGNLVGRARHILPDKIPEGYTVFTYDQNDAREYGLRLNDHTALIEKAYHLDTSEKEYDVTFIGQSKGREQKLREIEKTMNEKGLKTFFYIVPDRKFPFLFSKGLRPLPYDDFLSHVGKSRAVLNYVYEGQTGLSLRDIEALSNGVKLITNNASIRHQFFYNKEDIFILGEDNMDELGAFVAGDFEKLGEGFSAYYSFDSWLNTCLE